MRITNKTMSNSFLNNLNRNLGQMQKYHDQLSSGKLVSKPSDDPITVSKIMDLKNNIKGTEQYNKNIDDTIGWVDTQDVAMTGATKILQRVRELIIYGANDALSDGDREALAAEISESVNAIKDVLNINYDGRYVFGGQETKDFPFSVEGGELKYDGDNKNINREIGREVDIELISSGSEIVGENNELAKLFNDALTALNAGDTQALSGDILKRMDQRMDKVLSTHAKIGATRNRLDSAKSRNESEVLNLKDLLSKREDIDVAEKYMEYSIMSNVYRASLSIGSQILQPGLLDFLR